MGDERFNYSGKLDFLRRICVDSRLQRTAIAVASVIVHYADRWTGACYPSVARIVRESGVPKSTVLRALRRLEDCGWMTSERRTGSLNHYRLTSPEAGTGSDIGTGCKWNATSSIRNLRRGKTGSDGDTKAVPTSGCKQKVCKATGTEQKPQADAARLADPIWGAGLSFLQSKGIPEGKARSYLGKLCRDTSDIRARALLAEAETVDPVDPIAWLSKASLSRGRRSVTSGVATDFRNTTYTGTPLHEIPAHFLPDDLRD